MAEVTPIYDQLGVLSADLLPAFSSRWNARRKAAVVRAVLAGVISLDQAQALYRLSLSEFYSWQRFLRADGVDEVVARSLGIRTPSEIEAAKENAANSPTPADGTRGTA